MNETPLTQARLARALTERPSDIPLDVFDAMDQGLPSQGVPLSLLQRAAQAIYLDLAFRRVLADESRPVAYEALINTMGEECFSLPFQEVITRLVPNAIGEFLKTGATNELRTKQQGLKTHTTTNEIANESAEERALRYNNGTNGETWTFELGPLKLFGVYWGKLIEHILSEFEKRNTPLSDERLVEVLAHSSRAVATPPAMLDRQALDRILPLKTPEFEQALARYIHVTDTDASFIISTDELDPESISQRRCPMSTFGTIKQVYSFYADAAKYILEARQKQTQGQPN